MVRLSGLAATLAEAAGVGPIDVSLSHSGDHALAVAVAITATGRRTSMTQSVDRHHPRAPRRARPARASTSPPCPTPTTCTAPGMTSHASVTVMLACEDEWDIEFPQQMLKKTHLRLRRQHPRRARRARASTTPRWRAPDGRSDHVRGRRDRPRPPHRSRDRGDPRRRRRRPGPVPEGDRRRVPGRGAARRAGPDRARRARPRPAHRCRGGPHGRPLLRVLGDDPGDAPHPGGLPGPARPLGAAARLRPPGGGRPAAAGLGHHRDRHRRQHPHLDLLRRAGRRRRVHPDQAGAGHLLRRVRRRDLHHRAARRGQPAQRPGPRGLRDPRGDA